MGRQDFQVDPRLLRHGLLDNRYTELAITSEPAIAMDTMPPIHRDPFDRILLTQVMVKGPLLMDAR